MGSLDVGVVKAFDMARFFGQAQVLLHLAQDAVHMPVRVYNLHVFQTFQTVRSGIAQGKRNDCRLVPTLRHVPTQILYLQLHVVGKQQLLGGRTKALPDFRNGQLEHLGRRLLHFLFKLHGVGLQNRTFAYHEEVDIAKLHIVHHGVDVKVAHVGVEDGALGLVLL